jgi:hypothetical protein
MEGVLGTLADSVRHSEKKEENKDGSVTLRIQGNKEILQPQPQR